MNKQVGNFRILILVGVVLAIGFVIRQGIARSSLSEPDSVAERPLQLPPPPEIDPAEIKNLIPRDSIPAIDEPQFDTVSQAEPFMDPVERLIGLRINGEARAYPITILSAHEIVNDVVGGEPVAVTWCPLCYSALVFSRLVPSAPAPLTFGVSGSLLNNTLVMYDRQTESLWSQLYGAAVTGPHKDTSLAVFPSVLTDWTTWRQQHPDTLMLSKRLICEQFSCNPAGGQGGVYQMDPYASYYSSGQEGVFNRQIPRDIGSVEGKKRVLGVRVGTQARAYPFEVLEQIGLVEESIDHLPLLVWFDPVSESGVAFDRRLEDQVLNFRLDSENPDLLRDAQTNSQWQALSGEAIAGPLRGERLLGIVATPAFEFGWYGYFPNSSTFAP